MDSSISVGMDSSVGRTFKAREARTVANDFLIFLGGPRRARGGLVTGVWRLRLICMGVRRIEDGAGR